MGVNITYKGNSIASMSENGTKTLLTAGKYLEDNISVVLQGGGTAVPCKSFLVNCATDQTDKTYMTAANNEIVSHLSDPNIWVAIIPLFGYSSGLSFRGGFNTARSLIPGASTLTYGSFIRTNSSGSINYGNISKALTAAGADIGIDSSGRIFIYASSTVNLRAGDYLCLCGW